MKRHKPASADGPVPDVIAGILRQLIGRLRRVIVVRGACAVAAVVLVNLPVRGAADGTNTHEGHTRMSRESVSETSTTRLWYREPASEWIASLPVGNGMLGAMVPGEVAVDGSRGVRDSRTSIPSINWPNTEYEPSRCGCSA